MVVAEDGGRNKGPDMLLRAEQQEQKHHCRRRHRPSPVTSQR